MSSNQSGRLVAGCVSYHPIVLTGLRTTTERRLQSDFFLRPFLGPGGGTWAVHINNSRTGTISKYALTQPPMASLSTMSKGNPSSKVTNSSPQSTAELGRTEDRRRALKVGGTALLALSFQTLGKANSCL